MKIRDVFVSWKFKKTSNSKKSKENQTLLLQKTPESFRETKTNIITEEKNLSEQSPHWRFCLHPREENSTEISV